MLPLVLILIAVIGLAVILRRPTASEASRILREQKKKSKGK